MKSFNDTTSLNKWLKKVVNLTSGDAIEEIAKQAYKDSKKYTYIDTQTMYDSGENSDFKGGYVLLRAPQVRWLYYTTWIKGHKNPKAIPQWFEQTKIENIKDYVNMYNTIFNKMKKR